MSSVAYRFIADAMLGKLARWLRIIGFDTLYFNKIDDSEIIRMALQEQRVILTRDTELSKSKKIPRAVLIHSNNHLEQLKEVLLFLNKASREFSNLPCRCVICNGELVSCDKNLILNLTPEYILLHNKSFLRCSKCNKVFWHGSQKEKINRTIQSILQELSLNKS